MTTRAEVCEQLKSVLDSLGSGESTEVALGEGRAGIDGWGDFFSYCRQEHKKTVKTEFIEGSWSCTITKKSDTPSELAPAVEETPVVDVEVEKELETEPEPEPKSFFWGKKEDSE